MDVYELKNQIKKASDDVAALTATIKDLRLFLGDTRSAIRGDLADLKDASKAQNQMLVILASHIQTLANNLDSGLQIIEFTDEEDRE